MPAVRLPILTLAVRQQRYSCHGCGNCCRDFTVQLREDDMAKLKAQRWDERLNQPVIINFRGVNYLRQREDGACIFLMDDGLCRIHKEFGFSAKPVACELFPFHLTPGSGARGLTMGINFACQSVLENKGAELRTHITELGRMTEAIEELHGVAGGPPMLNDRLRATPDEEKSLTKHLDEWLSRIEVSLPLRLNGFAWIASSLAQAKLENVRGPRFNELLDVLFTALPDELQHHPIHAPTRRQQRMLRQAVFTRIEDPKLHRIEKHGRLRLILGQLSRSRRFKRGRGAAPRIGEGWPDNLRVEMVERIGPARDPHEIAAIDDLMTRYLRATFLGGRAWGAGYYGWSMIAGLQAVTLNVAVIGWLARLHAARQIANGEIEHRLAIQDVRAAIGRVDRTHGRAKWLGSSAERLRLAYLNMNDGLRRVVSAWPLVE